MKQEEIYPFFPSFSKWALPVFDLTENVYFYFIYFFLSEIQ